MKSAHASLIVFSGLAAFATGEALPPADIPIQCATICGPMVELTALCCPRDKLAKRRRLDEPVRFEGGSESTEGDGLRDDDRLERRKFVTLVPAPKSFPDEPTTNAATTAVKPADAATFPLASAAPSSSSSTSQPAVQEAGTTTAPLLHPPQAPAAPPPAAHVSSSQPPGQPAPTPATALARTTGIALGANGPIKTTTMTTNAAAPSSGSKQLPSSGGSQMEQIMGQPGIPMAMDAEEKCVCLNRSFDVARISGLCASCIMQANDVQNNMHVIMDTCNFPPLEYTPGDDGEANNLHVVASAPSVTIWGQKAGVASEATRTRTIRGVLGGVCLAMGVAVLL